MTVTKCAAQKGELTMPPCQCELQMGDVARYLPCIRCNSPAFLALPRPVGAACARNLALNDVRTKYVNWADDDDEFTDCAMSLRLRTLEETGVGWCAGYSQDLHEDDGSTTLWRCPTPPGRHEAGDVWRYWKDPADTIPLGPTTLLAQTDLVRAAPMGGLVQGEDYCALAVTCLAPGILLPIPVYRYRKHPAQMTAQDSYHELEEMARVFAHGFGASLHAATRPRRDVGSANRCALYP